MASGELVDTAAVARFIASQTGCGEVEILHARRLGGGAIQQNVALDVAIDGERIELVLRTDAPSSVAASRSRVEEFALLQAAHHAGVTVAEPLWLCPDPKVLGRPFFLMRRVAGIAAGHRVVRDPHLGGDRTSLAARLGAELARIHAIVPPRADLAFLGATSRGPLDFIAGARAYLDYDPTPRPALEWGLRWLERHAPSNGATVLAHRDFRTGNYLLDATGITAILDWEFAGWGDPHEDLGWFCAKCWRFGALDQEAGGIGTRDAFYHGYEAMTATRIDDARVRYYEVFAHARWAIIAIQQADRHLRGGEPSLELALTASIVPTLEAELLAATR